jgi:hypothetical protein
MNALLRGYSNKHLQNFKTPSDMALKMTMIALKATAVCGTSTSRIAAPKKRSPSTTSQDSLKAFKPD